MKGIVKDNSTLNDKVQQLCQHFTEVMQDDRYNYIFGLRDFYHLLRFIDRTLTNKRKGALEKITIFEGLKRNFHGVGPFDFQTICRLFEINARELKEEKGVSIKSNDSALESFISSLKDDSKTVGNLNDVAVRFKMLIDGSPDESIFRMLIPLKILDENKTSIFCGSAFEADNVKQTKTKKKEKHLKTFKYNLKII
jgi:hypothetical protein